MSNYRPINLSKKYIESAIYSENGIPISESVYDSTKYILSLLGYKLNDEQCNWEEGLIAAIGEQDTKKLSSNQYMAVDTYCLAFCSPKCKVNKLDIMNSLLLPLEFETWQNHKIAYVMDKATLNYIADAKFCSFISEAVRKIDTPFWIDFSKTELEIDGALVRTIVKDNKVYILAYSFGSDSEDEYMSHGICVPIYDEQMELMLPYQKCEKSDISTMILKTVALLYSQRIFPQKSPLQESTYKPIPEGQKPKGKFSEVDMYNIVITAQEESNV